MPLAGTALRLAKLTLCALWISAFTAAQNSVSPASPDSIPTFHSTSRRVVVNVVATDRDGNPIPGLKREDFELSEDGKPQRLTVFEPHVPARQPSALPDLHLGADEYTNFPKLAANSSINIVLFDILNTPTDDQMYARQQMIEFLKTLPRGQRVALFTLGNQLRMVTGFTTSTDELIAAAYKLRPGLSSLLDTDDDLRNQEHVANNLYSGLSPSNGGGPGGAFTMQQMMQDFSAETRLVRTDLRVTQTFEAMGAIARSLSGYPGRKNLIWLSEGFPQAFLPSRDDSRQNIRNYLAIFQKYSGVLEASQISVYPIDLRGLKNTSLQGIGGSGEYASGTRRNLDMIGSQMTMRDVAEQTGGRAFYNTNDLKVAMQRSIEHGATYYTVAYTPQNQDWNGALRKISVKLVSRPDVKLDYRHGYYATKDQPDPVTAVHAMMVAEMQPGVPESTMLLLRVKVLTNDMALHNVSIDYGVYAPDLAFTGEALKHARLEFVAVAWDKNNKAAGNVSQTEELDLKPETYQKMQDTGVPAHQEMTLKPGAYKLRMGVMDYSTGKIGTMEIPLTVHSPAAATR